MSELTHAPLPWSHNVEDGTIESAAGYTVAMIVPHANINTVARTGQTHSHADAGLICRAVNSHDELLAAHEPERSGPAFLDWIADRLVHVYHENPNVDFVQALRRRAGAAAGLREAKGRDMSKPHAIADEAILAAWGGVDGMDAERRAETADELRRLVESPMEGVATVGRRECAFDGHTVVVHVLRTALGGWDAVWRAVLKDEWFEPQFAAGTKWWNAAEGLAVARYGDKYLLYAGGRTILLRSPADLRVRVGHARGLFGNGED